MSESGNQHGFTFDTLKAIIDERDKRYSAQFDAQEKAVQVAQENTVKWQASANEWRQAMDDRERNFLSKSMGYVIGGITVITWLITFAEKFYK